MQQPKPNNKPFWSLIILLVVFAALRVIMLIALFRTFNHEDGKPILFSIALQSAVAFIILVAEAVVYRILRRHFYRMAWVWTHIILLYLVLVLLPLAYVILSFIVPRYFDPGTYAGWMARFSQAQVIIYWIGIGIAHLFFVLTIVSGFRSKRAIKSIQDEPAHLLDEFNE